MRLDLRVYLAASCAFFACAESPRESPDAGSPIDAGLASDAGAGDAEPADTGGADAALTAAGYCEATAADFCAFYLRCGRVIAEDQARCEAYFLAACNELYEPRYVALERAGLLELSAAGVEACRAHLSTVRCEEQLRDLDGPCAAMWRGSSPAGSACGLDVESFVCGSGTRCVLSLDLCGTCVAEVADGEACGSGMATCGPVSECRGGRCSARARIGEACGSERSCLLGARCAEGTCAAPQVVGAGEACDAARRCAYGASCVGGRCVAGGVLGDGCSAAQPCAVGRCAEGRCAPLLPDGAACTASLECADGPCAMGRCRALPSACLR